MSVERLVHPTGMTAHQVRRLPRLVAVGLATLLIANIFPTLIGGTAARLFGGALHAMPSASTSGETYGKLPMSFEKNAGQSRSGVDFIARGSGYSVFLTPGEAVLALKKHGPPNRNEDRAAEQAESAIIRMGLVGSSRGPAAGLDELPGKANYFIGDDPAKWHRSIPTFARVRYSGVYPGIDVLYYGNQRQLEYDFIVAPGADPALIALDFTGASARIEPSGDLVLATQSGDVSMHKPYIYQEINGVKRAVAGGYVKRADGRIGFTVGSYDTRKPLVIDPVLVYSTYLGGSDTDAATGIAVDLFGNAYVTGYTASTDFPTQNPLQAASGGGGSDAFVAKVNPSGSALVYSTYLGGSLDDHGNGITVDALGNAYVTGDTTSTNFPTTPGAYQATAGGGGDAFVAKINPSGSALVYSTYLGRSGYDVGTSIAVDGSGSAYVTGYNYLADFPTTPGAYQTATRGSYDAFITKIDPSGSALVYSTYLGGGSDDLGSGVAVDLSGNASVTGTTLSSDFPTHNPRQATSGGDYDAFVAKIDPSGSALVYSTYLGGSGYEAGRGIAVDLLGNAYVVGQTRSSNFPTTQGAYQMTYGGSEDAFVAKLDSSGSALVYSTYLGGSGGDAGLGVAVDLFGNAYVTGVNYLGDFPTTPGAYQATPPVAIAENFDAFFTKLNPSGSALVYSTYLGGSGNDLGNGIAVDLLGNAYVVGSTQSTDFPTTPGAYQATNRGIYDAFVAKISDPTAGNTPGCAKGAGTLTTNPQAGFAFAASFQQGWPAPSGGVAFYDRLTHRGLGSRRLTTLIIVGTHVTILGEGTTTEGATVGFRLDADDLSRNGRLDTFRIEWPGYTAVGTLRQGNVVLGCSHEDEDD